MDFITLTIELLKWLSSFFGGSFGWAIIFLTILVRLSMWSLSFSQQKSMREMQRLQPEMKRIQEKYKTNPQLMQQKMMEFYKKHDFNPMGGCLPLIIQMPIFILLYSALISPQFISIAGDSQFYFIKRLDATLKGNTGVSYNGDFQVGKKDIFSINKGKVTVTFDDPTKEPEVVKVNSKKALVVMGDVIPGENIDFKISLDDLNLKYAQLEKVISAKVDITDNSTREIETVEFKKDGDSLKASVPTVKSANTMNYDVLILILLFGASMYFAQEIMMATQKNQALDPQQASMQKMMKYTMPVMLTAFFIFGRFPIPAGVLLYMVVSNLFQIGQTVFINKKLEMIENEKKDISDDDISDAKKVKAKEVKTIEDNKED